MTAFLETRLSSLLREFRVKGCMLHLHCRANMHAAEKHLAEEIERALPLSIVHHGSTSLEAINKIAHVVEGKVMACGGIKHRDKGLVIFQLLSQVRQPPRPLARREAATAQ
jgi:hypothetical protein